MWYRLASIALAAGCGGSPVATTAPTPTESAPSPSTITIARGRAVTVDGRIGADEWADAASLAIETAPGWSVEARFKHDGTALLFAFTNLEQRGAFRYPEVVLDVANDGGPMMGADDFWFHASFRDCWSTGKVNDYKSCVPEAPGWSANNYTSQDAAPPVIELAIPLATLALTSEPHELGIAFDVTDTMATWSFWPARAQLAIPATWGHARVVP